MTLAPPLTRREVLTYIPIGGFLLLLVVFGFVFFRQLMPKSEWMDLGTTNALETEIEQH